jgi:formylglycine-generating enzyme required for sulfatase activity
MNRSFGLMLLFLIANPGRVFAQSEDSFLEVFDKLAKEKAVAIPAAIEKKAFEFVPIVKKGQTVTFKMGSKTGSNDESSVHDVTLTKPFEMQKTEVTQLQYFLVMMKNPSYFRKNNTNRPVEMVSYDDAKKFIAKLNELDTEHTYMLPTEAQWEYAARGGVSTEYFFSNDASRLSDYAWFEDNSGKQTHDVATKKPNLYGLYDVAGNVWEWVNDRYGAKYYSSLDKFTDPEGPATGDDRVLRGGGWNFDATNCRSSNRFHSPSSKFYSYGFRLVRTAK